MRELLSELKQLLGIGCDIWGGRTAEVNGRVARLMGQEVKDESPCEEYARLATLSFPSGKGIRQTLD